MRGLGRRPGKALHGLAKEALRPVLIVLLAVASYAVPKKRRHVVFLPGHDRKHFTGNLKWLFLYLQDNAADFTSCWLTDDDALAALLRKRDLPVARYLLFPIWAVLRAETIVIDTRHYSLCAGRFSIVQLWHGTGYKAAGAAAGRSRYRALLARHHHARYRLVTATSPRDLRHKCRIFGTSRVVVTGAPRNDIFFPGSGARSCRDNLGLAAYENVFLYTPTFRDRGAFEPFSTAAWRRISGFMQATQSLFAVKRHPLDSGLVVPTDLPGVADLTEVAGELQELLAATDLLITDYSSIATDFALTGRPIVFYIFDMEQYLGDSRELSAAYFELVPGPFARTEAELLALLNDDAPFGDRHYRDRYAQFANQFHSYRDGRSSERVLQQLRSL